MIKCKWVIKMPELQNVLIELRKNKGLTQQQLADMLNITQQAYGHYESGKRLPDIKTLIKIADFYNISLDILTGRYKKA